MLYQITSLILEIVAGLFGGACLLRLYMQQQRIPFGNPFGRFVMALSNWLVLPLRKVLPALGSLDTASLVGAFLIELAQFGVLWLLAGAGSSALPMVAMLALFGLLRLAISGLSGLVIVYALLSWVQTHSPLSDLIDRLCAPPLAPIRKVLPLIGGVDLSPLALLLLLQIAAIVLGTVQANLLLF